MAATQGIGIITRSSQFLTRIFGFAFRLRLLFFFMLFILINSLVIGIEARSLTPVISDLGTRFLTPTLRIQEQSLAIIENQGIYQKTPKFWGGVWAFISTIWGTITQFYIILMWISVLSKIILVFPLMDKSKSAPAMLFAIPLFLFFQMALIARTGKGDFFQPLYAFRDLFKALPYYLKPIAKLSDELTQGTENLTEIVNNSSS